MNNLLHAEFYRLRKNKLFLAGLGMMFFIGGFLVYQEYRQLVGYGAHVKLDSTFFRYIAIIGIAGAVCCSLFLSAEYGDGTIRSKLAAGHSRTAVYLAHLLTSIVAALCLCGAYILANIIIGIPLIGTLNSSPEKILLLLGGSVLTVAALCSVFTMISLLIQSRGIAPVACLLLMVLSLLFVVEVQRTLDQPEFWYDGTRNMAYVDGTGRECLEFLYNALPAGQELQYADRNLENLPEMCAYAVGLTVVTSAVGIFFFRRKDVR